MMPPMHLQNQNASIADDDTESCVFHDQLIKMSFKIMLHGWAFSCFIIHRIISIENSSKGTFFSWIGAYFTTQIIEFLYPCKFITLTLNAQLAMLVHKYVSLAVHCKIDVNTCTSLKKFQLKRSRSLVCYSVLPLSLSLHIF